VPPWVVDETPVDEVMLELRLATLEKKAARK
jgi:hypothetical protein